MLENFVLQKIITSNGRNPFQMTKQIQIIRLEKKKLREHFPEFLIMLMPS